MRRGVSSPGFIGLDKHLKAMEAGDLGIPKAGNRLFFLSVPPTVFGTPY